MNSELNKSIEKTCVIITTYSVIPNVKPLFASIESADIQLIIIADNSKDAWITNELKRTLPENFSGYFHYIKNDNIGKMAGAINKGFEFAKNNAFKLAFLLDDDAIISGELIKEELDCYNLHIKNSIKVGAVCPSVTNEDLFFNKEIGNSKYSFIRNAITSGLLVCIEAWEKVGGFDKRFPLDYSDIYFTESLIKNNFKIVRINRYLIVQSFGYTINNRNIRTKILGGFSRSTTLAMFYLLRGNNVMIKPSLYSFERERSIYKGGKLFHVLTYKLIKFNVLFPLNFLSLFFKFLITGDIQYMKVVLENVER